MAAEYPCPCCGHLVFDELPGSYDICPICIWEDDAAQLRFPQMGGANPPLVECQRSYQTFGACEQRLVSEVRPPRSDEPLDPGWRPWDPDVDDLEDPPKGDTPGMAYLEAATSDSYPDDLTTLYYWRPTYWRRRRDSG